MKAGIYDPYLDTLGGGEKYCLALADLLLKSGWEVDLFWGKENLKEKIKKRLGIDLGKAAFVSPPGNLLKKFIIQRQYDLLFYIGDGSIPFMFAKKNILHFQVPFKKATKNNFFDKLKAPLINNIVCNSFFTKSIIDREFRVTSKVIYPPVETNKFPAGKKENIILSVGRFSKLLQAKNQDVLIKSFKNLVNKGLTDWQLVLIGGSDVGGANIVRQLKKMSRGFPIKILENVSLTTLSGFYSKAKIFWAANGYGIDEEKQPEKVEHFGIAVVEAMSAGVIPLLVSKGGFKEIVENQKSGFFWEKTGDLEEQTLKLVKADLKKFQLEAQKRSQLFSREKFNESIKKIIF